MNQGWLLWNEMCWLKKCTDCVGYVAAATLTCSPSRRAECVLSCTDLDERRAGSDTRKFVHGSDMFKLYARSSSVVQNSLASHCRQRLSTLTITHCEGLV